MDPDSPVSDQVLKAAYLVTENVHSLHLPNIANYFWEAVILPAVHAASEGQKLNFQAVIKSAASAASLRGGRAGGRLDHVFFFAIFGRASAQKNRKKNE